MFDFDYLFEWRLRLNEITSNYVHILDVLVSLLEKGDDAEVALVSRASRSRHPRPSNH